MSPDLRSTSVRSALSALMRSMSTCKPVYAAPKVTQLNNLLQGCTCKAMSVPSNCYTCQRLLSNQPLSLSIQLLNEFPWEQACIQYLHPASNSILHETELEDLCFFLCPARRGCEIPSVTESWWSFAAMRLKSLAGALSMRQGNQMLAYREAASPTLGPRLFSPSLADIVSDSQTTKTRYGENNTRPHARPLDRDKLCDKLSNSKRPTDEHP